MQFDRFVLGVWGTYLPWHNADFRLTHGGTTVVTSTPIGDGGYVITGTTARPPFTYTGGLDTVWAIGGRAGVTVGQDTLLYVLAGYTEATGKLNGTPTLPAMPDFKGYTVGGGIETMIARGSWSAVTLSLEYSASFFESQPLGTTGIVLDPTDHRVMLGVSFRFGVPQIVN